MSEYERNKGKLTPIHILESAREQYAEQVIFLELAEHGRQYAEDCITKNLAYYNLSYWEMLCDNELSYGFVTIDKKLYKFELEEAGCDPEYCNVTKNQDDSFSFESYHYKGGAHWTELLKGKLD